MQNDVLNFALNGLSRAWFTTRNELSCMTKCFSLQRIPPCWWQIQFNKEKKTYVSKELGGNTAPGRGSELLLRRWQSPRNDPGTRGCFISAFSKIEPGRIQNFLWSSFAIISNKKKNQYFKRSALFRVLSTSKCFFHYESSFLTRGWFSDKLI